MEASLKKSIVSAFKMHGLSLRSDASNYLTEILTVVNAVEREDWIDKILDEVQKQTLSSNIIDADVIEIAIKECNAEEDGGDQVFSVINAFDIPKYTYLTEKKKFIKYSEANGCDAKLLSKAEHKVELFRERYQLLHQRTMRHKLFTPPIPGMEDEASKKFKLRTVEYLLGCSSKLKDIIALGMLSQLKERKYFLEDLTGAVELDLSQAKFHSGLFTENCFVLAEGWYEDNIFHVTAFGFPPPELAKTTRAYYGNINFFGGNSDASLKSSTKLQQIEKENEDAMIVILSDVWFDQEKVLQKLETMFIGFQDAAPTCFVFCGNFISEPYGANHIALLKESFNNFMKILLNFPSICQSSKFVFVPSLEDVGPSKIFPRPALPDCIAEPFMKKIPNAIFSSNPCRIQYCTQEIVIFREDIIGKMIKSCIRCPTEHIPSHFVKTIVAQAHLSPLPLYINPIYWQHDQALRLYPLPDLVIVADKTSEIFHETVELDCTIANPGSFSCCDYTFKVYYPSSKTIEDSKIED
uniref:DNA polymerase epsilon subunit 2-like n=1 Tax=Styela clava TaxID=7725 RepID=UPI00193ADEE8|nr:DNA polymerase epsilon subunit 2-like [Styela clava]